MKNNEIKSATEKEIETNLDEMNYPSAEDIYNQEEKLADVDPNKINTENPINKKKGEWNENTLNTGKEDELGGDLDVPGSELDNQQENIGSEDEENNYYSQGDTK